ncbi:tautomerase family protein [Marinobacterium zhoushanense]|uniref:Tautomerase family protein n=1 Tax=Marinobacterium zhoushanense TaxID=1679163 RepID=A0ABQ1KMM5_9GAMM|nr:tautomerase family protein [Marinobacterium zhoushanense]GGC00725.1 tautomerase family protein [Marinobacterium zhoushanense]
MPFTRIALREGKPDHYIQGVSDALHRALVDCFEVPPADRFQLIEELPAGRLVCDRHYMAADGRTANTIIFQITAGRERSEKTRNTFFARLVEELQASVGISAADVMVIITTNRLGEWSFSGGVSAGAQA